MKNTCLIFALSIIGLNQIPMAAAQAGADPATVAQQKMKRLDANANGSVTFDEFTAARTAYAQQTNANPDTIAPKRLREAFDRMDSNGGGTLSLEEVAASGKK